LTTDPVVTLSLIVGALCLAVAGWKLRQKELASAKAGGQRRGGGYEDDDDFSDLRAPRQQSRRDDYDEDRYERARAPRQRGRRDYDDELPAEATRSWGYLGEDTTGRIRTWDNKAPEASGDREGEKIEVQVNPGKCVRFGFCEHEAPEIFNLKGDGRLGYKTTATGEQIDAVDRAMKICPARAIKMKRPGSKMYMPQTTGEIPRYTEAGGGRRRRDEY
jgi:ferredoxin